MDKGLVEWFEGKIEDEDEVFDYVIDLTALANFAPKTPNSEEDINNIKNGVKLIVKAFGYKIKSFTYISADGCGSQEYIANIKKELEELEKEQCDLLLVKEYDSYIFCIEPS